MRKVFFELRRRCRERQVELIDVDLRWVITEEEAQQGKVLPICLAEIDRARPFFMGLLGERYGWVPAADQFDRSLWIEQPWLEEHAGGKSVTELKILHGVLNNSRMAGRAFFYFRDPQWSTSQAPECVDGRCEEAEKLAALKQRIRSSGFRVENYPDPNILAERVREDLWKLIDDFSAVMRLMPKSREIKEQSATVYAIRSHERFENGQFVDAADEMTEAIRLAPESPVNYHRRGACWFHMGEYQRAYDDLAVAISKEPGKADHYDNRAQTLQRMGRNDKAEADLKKARELRGQ